MKAYWGSGNIAPRILDLGTRWRWVVSFTPGRFTPRERAPGTHRLGGCVGPRADVDAVAKRMETRVCTKYSIPAATLTNANPTWNSLGFKTSPFEEKSACKRGNNCTEKTAHSHKDTYIHTPIHAYIYIYTITYIHLYIHLTHTLVGTAQTVKCLPSDLWPHFDSR
jgi:hypothetical protein